MNLSTETGASKIGYKTSSAGVKRTVEDRLKDVVSAIDEGVSLTGELSANAGALLRAAEKSDAVYLPDGHYPLHKSGLSAINKVIGSGYFDVSGSIIPVGDIRGELTLPVPSVFSDIYSIFDYLGARAI